MALLAYALHVILRLFELFSTKKKIDGTIHHVKDGWCQDFRQLVRLLSCSGNKEMSTGSQLTSPFDSDHQSNGVPTITVSFSTSIHLLGNPSRADPKAYLLEPVKLTLSIKQHTDNMAFCRMGSISAYLLEFLDQSQQYRGSS